ncbi:MAG: sugar nucleotide-binding protein [Bdellovibrionota bacterium]
MKTPKSILIIGGSGFVGTHLALKLRENYRVFATFHHHKMEIRGVSMLPLSVQNRDLVKKTVYFVKPDIIIFAAGTNDIEAAQKKPALANAIHTWGAATLSDVCEILQPRFIYLSNSYVFDGFRGNYHEHDTPVPSTDLGKVKLAGENFVRSKSLNHVIIRSTPLIGRGNGINISFTDLLRMKLMRGERIELSDKELHNFAEIDGFVNFVVKIIETGARKKIFHYGGLTKMSPFEFGKIFAQRFGFNGDLIFQITPKKTKKTVETAVADFSLNVTQGVESLKIKPLLLEESLDLIQQKLVPAL